MAMYPNQGPVPPSGPDVSPQAAPRPLSEAIQELPGQYLKIITKPAPGTFAEELGKADWGIVWTQLIIWAIITAILGYFARLILPLQARSAGIPPDAAQTISTGTSLGSLIGVPLGFFIWMSIIYLMAKIFNGRGTFLRQSYASLLFQVPLGIISSILGLIPYLGLLSFAVFIYGIVLQIYAVMAAHRLSGGQATAVVLLPSVIIGLLICGLALAFIGIILALFGLNR